MKRHRAVVNVCEYLDSEARVVVALTDSANISADRVNDQGVIDGDRRHSTDNGEQMCGIHLEVDGFQIDITRRTTKVIGGQ